jgi:hypothetical protein
MPSCETPGQDASLSRRALAPPTAISSPVNRTFSGHSDRCGEEDLVTFLKSGRTIICSQCRIEALALIRKASHGGLR